jgi:asparagine synthetase B (glutamine-hydrolysing)
VNAFADFQVNFGAEAELPPLPRLAENVWRAARTEPGSWTASIAAAPASTLVQTRDVAPWSVWLLGELLRYDALSVPADPLGAFVLDLRAGRERASLLDGHFVIFAWNSHTREWHVWTDRFGTMHAYTGLGARRSALGTFHPSVLKSVDAKRLDWSALSGFFAMGFFPEDRTHFEELQILRPATHSVFDATGLIVREERYWQWEHTPEKAPRFEDALESFGGTLGGVMRDDTANGRIAVPISGGLDSRTTVALLPKDRDRLWCYSYGYGRDSVETRIARQVAEARGLACETLSIDEYLFGRMDDVLAATEGFNDVTLTRQVSVAGRLATQSDAVIGAHMGDLWLGHASEATDTDAALDKVLKQGRRWLLDHLCAPRLTEHPESLVREGVARELERVSHITDLDFRMKAFKTDGWCFRWTAAGLRAYQLGAFPRLPFYDTRVADLFCTLPTDYVRDRRLQVEWLKRYAPDLARITWQQHDADLYSYKYANTLLLPKRAMKKARRLFTRRPVIERNWEVQFLSAAGQEHLRDALTRPGRHVHEFVSAAAITELLDRFFARPLEEKRGYTVSMLLTFSEWLERYA